MTSQECMHWGKRHADLVSCKCGYMSTHLKPRELRRENKKAQKGKSEIVHNFVTEGSSECIFSLHFSIWLVRHKSAGLTLNGKCLLDIPPVVKRCTAGYFTQFFRVEIYCLNLTRFIKRILLRGVTIKWRGQYAIYWLWNCKNIQKIKIHTLVQSSIRTDTAVPQTQ